MSLVSIINEGRHINNMGIFYIYKETKVDNEIKDDKNHLVDTIKFNPDTLRSLPSFLLYKTEELLSRKYRG
jgi:hypothetical protein